MRVFLSIVSILMIFGGSSMYSKDKEEGKDSYAGIVVAGMGMMGVIASILIGRK